MKYKVTHTTTYDYTEVVPVCQNQVHLSPRQLENQSCGYHRLLIQPRPATSSRRTDFFGNQVNWFEVIEPHKRLVVSAVSRVELSVPPVPPAPLPAWEAVRATSRADRTPLGLTAHQFHFSSPRVPILDVLRDYALVSFLPERPLDEAALDLTRRIHQDFEYDAEATSVDTPVEEVIQLRKGVCQDLAHVEIGCFRALGLASRYVSGYLRTIPPPGQPRLVGSDASHAWCSVYCGGDSWLNLDPTNDLVPSTDHIVVAWGRDFSDVVPVRGMFIGGGKHEINVSVDVEPQATG